MRKILVFVTVLTSLCLLPAARVAAQDEQALINRDSVLTTAGAVNPINPFGRLRAHKDETGRYQVRGIPGSSSIRAHFEIVGNKPTAQFELTIVNPARQEEIWWAYEVGPESPRTFWSEPIPGDTGVILLKLKSDQASQSPLLIKVNKASSVQVPWEGKTLTHNKLKVINDAALAAFPNLKAASRAVARLTIPGDDGITRYCTGFLISPGLVMTNRHCVLSGSEARGAKAHFDYEQDLAPPKLENGLKFSEIVLSSCDLDFILLRLKQPFTCQAADCSGAADRAPLALEPSAAAGTSSAAMVVIQHPQARALRVSVEGCQLTKAGMIGNSSQLTDFGHSCDTEDSSSGSPVLLLGSGNRVGKVVGLHHMPFRTDDVASLTPIAVNRAVMISKIVEYIKIHKPLLCSELKLSCVP